MTEEIIKFHGIQWLTITVNYNMANPKSKKVVISKTPNSNKKVLITKDPENYKSLNICWQLSLMDFEFEFGWGNVINRFEFTSKLKEQLLIELASYEDSDFVYNAVDKISPNYFDSTYDFFKKLENIGNIDTKHVLCIITKLKENFFWNELFPKLKNLESLKWNELEIETFGKKGKSKHHWVSTNSIIKEARLRLTELKLDDYQEIFSIRLTGTNRLWGIRIYNYFQLLWFDYDHEICPSLKN